MSKTVRCRFAPSPTGYLHVGGARTALFNYLLARHTGGVFVLRIEDTDQTRNIENADRRLLEDMRWLGLNWDEGPEVGGEFGPYYQSQRLERYTEHAKRLLDSGKAYYAFETREELDAMRAEARAQKRTFRYPRPGSFPSESDAEQARAEGRPAVVRFKMPGKDSVIPDAILGDVRIGADELDDIVIVKADGWPTYHFAVVVDDEHMKVTHVLRGQEHLMNTPNHLALQEAFGYAAPTYAHLPIILNMDGSKMGKREKDKAVRAAVQAALKSNQMEDKQALELAGCDADEFARWLKKKTQLEDQGLHALARELTVPLPEIQIHDFRVSGYLPEVLINFIALLGWSPGGDREKMTLDEMCELFGVERVGKTNARFDREKLLNFNTTALAAAGADRKLAGFGDYLSIENRGPMSGLGDALRARLLEMCPTARIFRDIEEKTAALFAPDDGFAYDPTAVKKTLLKSDGAGLGVLRQMRAELEALADWCGPALEKLIREFAEQRELGLGKVAQPLRVAVTGTTVSPPIFDTLAVLGRERTLFRIDRSLAHATAQAQP